MLLQNADYQRTQVFSALQAVQSYCYSMGSDVSGYFSLRKDNEGLLRENAKLRNALDHYQNQRTATDIQTEQLNGKLFTFLPAKVVNNTTNKQHNLLMLNVGEEQGITSEMGVIADNGVVGIVINTSEHYAIVMSLLNRDFRISARLKRSGHLGTLMWDGLNYQEAILSEVPQHVPVMVGDTVETSGHSAMFPEGITVGTVIYYKTKKGNFHEIRLKLNGDFKKLRFVNVVKSIHYDEQKNLEKQTITPTQ
jgi:rod shape-determining protein MreC